VAAYLIGQIRVKDKEKWQQYVAGVAGSLQGYDAEVIFRGKRTAVLAGDHDKDLTVVIRFTDQQGLQKWFEADTYQRLIPLRDSAAEVTIVTYDSY